MFYIKKINDYGFFPYALTGLLIALFIVLMGPIAVKASTVYYVAPNGNDSSNGTSLDTPFRSIQKAASAAAAGDTIYIRGGTYRETVQPVNSGTAENPITYQAYQSEEVVISGLNAVNASWTKYAGNVYYTNYSMRMGDKNAVFAQGNYMTYARWPDKTDSNPMTNDGAEVDSGTLTSITDNDMPNLTPDSYNGAIVWCIAGAKWTAWGTTVTGSGNGTIHFTIPGGDISNYHNPGDTSRGDKNYYYLSGKLDFLDRENEWFYDAASGRVYLYAPGGADPGSLNIEVKARDQAIDLTDKSYIHFKNINIKGASMKITGNYNVIDGMKAVYVFSHNANGMFYSAPVEDNGIHITGCYNTVKNGDFGYSAGNMFLIDKGAGNLITNNYIHHTDLNGCYDCPIRLENTYNDNNFNTITHNTIFSTGRSAIHFIRPAYFKYNDISATNIICDDGAPIYCGGDLKNTEIAYNTVHDIQWHSGTRNGVVSGIYMDDRSFNITAHHNLLYNIGQDGAFRFNTGGGRYAYNNTTYHCPDVFDAHITNAAGSYVLDNNFHNQDGSNFVDAANHNFHLAAGSTAIDTGNEHQPWTDWYSGNAPDKGCYEYGGIPWTAGVISEEMPPISVAGIKFTDLDGGNVTTIAPSEFIRATVNITNNNVMPFQKTALILALYDEMGKLIDLTTTELKFGLGDNADIVTGLRAPHQSGNYQAKVFVWDDLKRLTPLTPSIRFPCE